MSDELLHIPEEDYQELIRPYTDAMSNVRMRLEILNKDYRKKNNNYPIHFIQTRIKKRESLEKKLMKKVLVKSYFIWIFLNLDNFLYITCQP